ncbi:methylmalonyl-CoA epimerase [Nonlabens dokdonensis]|jgi:methylmalonyl-CoA/ethylmalonyl-CoA epimerase|uniref:Lactoylglutathione lyase (Glyoxalase I) n=3 Tax=Nonlabens dokdonensis TaxID=328515 RepID=L7W9T6_NONDD|nr:methylmalonyl-CoA epimerase [Nonlabens dokdonensis]AGC76606.1 lactoylglutathione lyase (Glyoxalase I) [Nonlabens dokdonensis DSW-6]PZX44255.1 methylmalonyl-CoA epimerase [Nonlabens dokdonensis]
MFGKIEHLGIAVKNLEQANEVYTKLLGRQPYKSEAVESEAVETSFFMTGENKIELLAATSDDSAIAKYVAKRGEGIHHVAFAVEDIKAELVRLEKEGFQILNKEPKRGADNKWVAFVHPKGTNGVLVELCQEIEE